jgi:hypothetical protein
VQKSRPQRHRAQSNDCERARLPDQVAHSICVVRMFLFLGFLWIAAPLIAAENLLIVDVYVRILPEDQIEPIPDPFLEAIPAVSRGHCRPAFSKCREKHSRFNPYHVIFGPSSRSWTVRESNSPLRRWSCRMADVRSQISSWGPHQSPPGETCCHQIHRKR